MNQDLHRPPRVHAQPSKPVLRMINKYNIAELSLVDRPVDGAKTGFNSVVPRHEGNVHQRFFNTETRDNFGEPQDLDMTATIRMQTGLAGGHVRPEEK